MRFISKVRGGYLVRRTIAGKKFARYFSTSKFGSMYLALSNAKTYRDELSALSVGRHSYQRDNCLNTTGQIGVAMHCRTNPLRANGVVHQIRAQVPAKDGQARYRSWSIKKHGIMGAYTQAVNWRRTQTGERPLTGTELDDLFCARFLPLYMKHARDEVEERERIAFLDSLTALYSSTTSERVRDLLREGRVCT